MAKKRKTKKKTTAGGLILKGLGILGLGLAFFGKKDASAQPPAPSPYVPTSGGGYPTTPAPTPRPTPTPTPAPTPDPTPANVIRVAEIVGQAREIAIDAEALENNARFAADSREYSDAEEFIELMRQQSAEVEARGQEAAALGASSEVLTMIGGYQASINSRVQNAAQHLAQARGY